jgi:SAM-dependent methyltransferase
MRKSFCLLAIVFALASQPAFPQDHPDDEAVWRAFITWFRTAPLEQHPLTGHAAALEAQGVPPSEVQRRRAVLARLFNERSDWVEVFYDRTFTRPLTGDPARDGFNAEPSRFLEDAIEGLRKGTALDAGMGQGRNAVFLARKGWTVTGFDLSWEAVSAARRNASRAAVPLEVFKASYDSFEFGTANWDLIVMTFAWAPVTDPAFVARLHRSLRPGGRIVFEHFIDDPAQPRPTAMHALKPGELRELFKAFRIERYEEVDGVGDWGGPGQRLVRMVASKATDT